jgi:hypothetical protein
MTAEEFSHYLSKLWAMRPLNLKGQNNCLPSTSRPLAKILAACLSNEALGLVIALVASLSTTVWPRQGTGSDAEGLVLVGHARDEGKNHYNFF